MSLAGLPDGTLASGSFDRTIKLWKKEELDLTAGMKMFKKDDAGKGLFGNCNN